MKEIMYENSNYLIEQDLVYSYITNKKTYKTEKYFLEDKTWYGTTKLKWTT